MQVSILDSTVDPLHTISMCARTCYNSRDKYIKEKQEDFIRGLIKSGHESPLENAVITFDITGISRACSHQLVRHRVASYCISGDTIIPSFSNVERKTGKFRTIRKMYEWHKKGLPYNKKLVLRSMNSNHTIVGNKVLDIFYNGIKSVYEVTTESGRKIKTTKNHKFFTRDGWKELEDIKKGDYVMVNGVELLYNKDWLEYNYITLNRTRRDISKEIGCCEATLYKSFKKFGIIKPHSKYPNRKAGHGIKGMLSEESRKRISEKMSGQNNHRYIKDRNLLSISGGYTESLKKYDRKNNVCEFCGGSESIEVHHIDKNPRNNINENIKFLCSKCHKLWHKQKSIGSFLDKVLSIKYVGKEDVYDLEMEEPYHNYIANGFVVHNCQMSQRYVNQETNRYVIPEEIKKDGNKLAIYENAIMDAKNAYKELLYLGIKREDARFVLPEAMLTSLTVTMNFRELRHFLKLRTDSHSQWEIRNLANKMAQLVIDKGWGVLVEDIVEKNK